jgi:hypothetical protein
MFMAVEGPASAAVMSISMDERLHDGEVSRG